MNKIVIHNNNINLSLFDNRIRFITNDNIDDYISTDIIPELIKKEFDFIFIKDNLSTNYLELLGIRVAYHIRLSQVLKEKRYIPIIILSDTNSHLLNKLNPIAKILFTKHIFIISNTKEAIEKISKKKLKSLTLDEYKTSFLNNIEVEQPKDYLTHHGIANEWSIYRWAEYLDVNTRDIEKIRDEISSMLYFKYLQAKFPIKRSSFSKHKQEIQGKGKILYIDDEWEKGWKSIFEHLSLKSQDYSLETVEEVYKDKTQEEIIAFVIKKVISNDPDVVILDMRLHKDDFLENVPLADFTGIQIYNQIKDINPGIQIIIFTASSNSLLLDELYSYNSSILGYIKKEHPKNYNLTTQGNINKLIRLINKGFERKFLKEIYKNKLKILTLLENDVFTQYGIDFDKYKLFWKKIIVEIEAVFDILDSDRDNRFLYATVSIAISIESILSIFIPNDRKMIFWDGEVFTCHHNALRCRINKLFEKLGSNENFNMQVMIDKRNNYMHNEPVVVTQVEIKTWFKKLLKMIEIIENPINLRLYDKNNVTKNLQNMFNNR